MDGRADLTPEREAAQGRPRAPPVVAKYHRSRCNATCAALAVKTGAGFGPGAHPIPRRRRSREATALRIEGRYVEALVATEEAAEHRGESADWRHAARPVRKPSCATCAAR